MACLPQTLTVVIQMQPGLVLDWGGQAARGQAVSACPCNTIAAPQQAETLHCQLQVTWHSTSGPAC